MKILLLIAWTVLDATFLLHADDWTTSDGTVYKNVKVLSHDAGYVTVLDSDGGSKIPLRLLSANLQKQFGYVPSAAAACEAATVAADKRERQAVLESELARSSTYTAPAPAISNTPVYTASRLPAAPAPATTPEDPAKDDQFVAAQRADLEERLRNLQDDVTVLQKEKAIDQGSGSYQMDNSTYNHGGCDEKLDADQREIADIKNKLSQMPQTVSSSTPSPYALNPNPDDHHNSVDDLH